MRAGFFISPAIKVTLFQASLLKIEQRIGGAGNVALNLQSLGAKAYVISTLLGWGRVDGFNLYSILVATGGAVLALIIYNAITGRRRNL